MRRKISVVRASGLTGLGLVLLAAPLYGGAVEFHSNLENWVEFVPSWKARAFEQDFGLDPGPNGCRSAAGTVAGQLDGGVVQISLSGGACPIRDETGLEAATDAYIPQGQTLSLEFDPPIRAFYSYYGSLAVGQHVTLTLVSGDTVDYPLDSAVSQQSVFGSGHGFVASVPIERLEFQTSEAGTSVLGRFVGLQSGTMSFEEVDPSLSCNFGPEGISIPDVPCDFAYAYEALVEPGVLLPDDPREGSFQDGFGAALARHADTVAVGAVYENDDSGAVYIFERDRGGPRFWGLRQRIPAPVSTQTLRFGWAVDLQETQLVVGSHSALGMVGEAYVFERCPESNCEWTLAKTLQPGGENEVNRFGWAVAARDDLVVVSARKTDENDDGVLYFHGRDEGGPGNWGQMFGISNGASNFGFDLALTSGGLLATAPHHDAYFIPLPEPGTVVIPFPVLSPAGLGDDPFYGSSVAADGDTLVIAAEQYDGNRGVVFVYENIGTSSAPWVEVQKIEGDAIGPALKFGWDVALAGGHLVVSAAGEAHVFRETGPASAPWQPVDVARPPTTESFFGFSVASGPNSIVVGSIQEGPTPGGRAYVIDYPIFADGFESGGTTSWSATTP